MISLLLTLLLQISLGVSFYIPRPGGTRLPFQNSRNFEMSFSSSSLQLEPSTELPQLNVWMSMFSNGKLSGGVSLNIPDEISNDISSKQEIATPLSTGNSITDILRLSEFENVETDESLPALPDVGAWRAAVTTGGIDLPPSLEAFLSGSVDLQPAHEAQVLSIWSNLKKRSSLCNLSDADRDRVIGALRIAYVTLYGKTTLRSLEVAINRAHGTAAVLGELKAGVDVVIAGILHAVFADVEAPVGARTRSELSSRFGGAVIQLVDQYARLPRFMTAKAEYSPLQAENQVQMLVAAADNFSVLLIRISERLHSMRVLRSLPLNDDERIKLAEEALHVYAPLAHKMGLIKIKGEFEDLAFRSINPHMFKQTRYTQTAANKAFHEAADTIEALVSGDPFMAEQRATYKLDYRIKGKYQLYLKMKRKNLASLNDVRDALGLRVIIRTPAMKGESEAAHNERNNALCYHLVERLRNMSGWTPCERGFKDYISKPKANGYQSLHQYIRNDALGTNVEVQVRTLAMHSAAELGEAAHWFYKDQVYRKEVANSKLYRLAWRSDAQAKANSPGEMLAMARNQLAESRVFVYLNDRSQVLNLRTQATALDAAFSIHSDVGLSTVAVKVNGKRVALNRPLRSGDVVNVERAPEGTVTVLPSWLYLSHCPNTHSVIRKFFRDHQRDQLVCEGLLLLTASLVMSAAVVEEKLAKGPMIHRIVTLVKSRSAHSDLASFLLALASFSKHDARQMLARVFCVPVEELKVPTVPACLAWGRSQQKEKWSAHPTMLELQQEVVRDMLPTLGMPLAEMRWRALLVAGGGKNELSGRKPAVTPVTKAAAAVTTSRLPFVTRGSLLNVAVPQVAHRSVSHSMSSALHSGRGSAVIPRESVDVGSLEEMQ